nr:MAG TPA: hypothetical protein [Bacteriophage sp.]
MSIRIIKIISKNERKFKESPDGSRANAAGDSG